MSQLHSQSGCAAAVLPTHLNLTMSPPTFPLFTEFPKVIQVIILRHASHLNSSRLSSTTGQLVYVSAYTSTLFRTMVLLPNSFPVRYNNRIVTFIKIIKKLPFRTRLYMMSTSLLTSLVRR